MLAAPDSLRGLGQPLPWLPGASEIIRQILCENLSNMPGVHKIWLH